MDLILIFHIVYCRPDNVGRAWLRVGIAEQRYVSHRRQVVVQQRRGVAQVLPSVPVAQRYKYFLENVVALADARHGPRLYVVWPEGAFGIDGGMRPGEVNPVDGPRLLFVGSVCVRFAGRQDNILVGPYVMPFAAYTVPPRALYTVYQHVLRYGLRAFAVVAGGLGVVSYVCYV